MESEELVIGRIIEHFNTPITVRRATDATEFTNGLADVVEVDTFSLSGINVQPLTGRERELLPEGIRDKGLIKLYTQCPLLSVDVEGKVKADRLDYRDQEYVVQTVEDWCPNGGYYKVLAIKVND